MKRYLGIMLLSALSTTAIYAGGSSAPPLENSNPIVLSHGMLGFSDDEGLLGGLVKYWGGMDEYLLDEGAPGVFMPGKSALGGLADRASQQKEQILMWMAAHGYTKVNQFGHSQGAPDSRYMISNLGMSNKVAVMTSISGVNNGAPMADIVSAIIPSWLEPFVDAVVGLLLGLVYGDSEQDLAASLDSLAVSNAAAFNASTPNMGGVAYYSYGSYITIPDLIQHPLMGIVHPATAAGGLFYGQGITNDGLVPVSSMKHGTWKGGPGFALWVTGIDHLQIVNLEWIGQLYFDVEGFFLEMAENAMNNQ